VRVRETLIREGQGSKNDKNNSNPNNRFHTISPSVLLFAARALNQLRYRKPTASGFIACRAWLGRPAEKG
jgi:hypothetical protein